MNFRKIIPLALLAFLWACEKDNTEPKGPSDYTTFNYNTSLNTDGAQTAEAPTGNPWINSFPDTALNAYRRFTGDGLTGGAEDRGICDGFTAQTMKTRTLVRYQQVVAIVVDTANAWGTMAVPVTAQIWQAANYSNQWELVIVWDSLHVTRMDLFCGNPPNPTNGQITYNYSMWGMDVDQLSGQTVKTWKMWYKAAQGQALGFPTPLKAIVFPHNGQGLLLQQLPGFKPTHVVSALSQEATNDDFPASGVQSMSGDFPCFQLNGFEVQTMENAGGLLTITAMGPLGLQAVQLSNEPVAGWTEIQVFTLIGKESYLIGTVWSSSSSLTKAVFSWGSKFTTAPNGTTTTTETATCYKRV